MPEGPINYDLGLSKRKHPDGVDVYMYHSEPGVYRNAFGAELPEEFAAEAGFPVEKLRKLRVRSERIAQAMAEIEADLALSEGAEGEIIKERGGIKVVQFPGGNCRVQDEEGRDLTAVPLPREQALLLLSKLAKPEGKADAKKAPTAREKGPKEAEAAPAA